MSDTKDQSSTKSFTITNKTKNNINVYERSIDSGTGVVKNVLKTTNPIAPEGIATIQIDGDDVNYVAVCSGQVFPDSTLSFNDVPLKNINIMKIVSTKIEIDQETGDEKKVETVTWDGYESNYDIAGSDLALSEAMYKYVRFIQANPEGKASQDVQAELVKGTDMKDFFNGLSNTQLHGADVSTFKMVLEWIYSDASCWQATFYLYLVPQTDKASDSPDANVSLFGTMAIKGTGNQNCGTLTQTNFQPVTLSFVPGVYKKLNPQPGYISASDEGQDTSVNLQPYYQNVTSTNTKGQNITVVGMGVGGTVNGQKVIGSTVKLPTPDTSDGKVFDPPKWFKYLEAVTGMIGNIGNFGMFIMMMVEFIHKSKEARKTPSEYEKKLKDLQSQYDESQKKVDEALTENQKLQESADKSMSELRQIKSDMATADKINKLQDEVKTMQEGLPESSALEDKMTELNDLQSKFFESGADKAELSKQLDSMGDEIQDIYNEKKAELNEALQEKIEGLKEDIESIDKVKSDIEAEEKRAQEKAEQEKKAKEDEGGEGEGDEGFKGEGEGGLKGV